MGQTIRVHEIGGGGGGAVDSFNGRTGAVVPQSGDYNSTQVTNNSSVSGSSVTDALNTLNASGASGSQIDYDNPTIEAGTTLTLTDADDKKAFFFTANAPVAVTIDTDTITNPDFRVYLNSLGSTIVKLTNTAVSGTVDDKASRSLFGTENGIFAIDPSSSSNLLMLEKQVTPSVSLNFFRDGAITTNTVLVPPSGQNNPNNTGHGGSIFSGTLTFATITVEEFTTNNSTSFIDVQFEYKPADGSSTGPYSAGSGTPLGGPVRLNFPNTLGAGRFDISGGAFLDAQLPTNSMIYCYVSGQTATSISGITAVLRVNNIQ